MNGGGKRSCDSAKHQKDHSGTAGTSAAPPLHFALLSGGCIISGPSVHETSFHLGHVVLSIASPKENKRVDATRGQRSANAVKDGKHKQLTTTSPRAFVASRAKSAIVIIPEIPPTGRTIFCWRVLREPSRLHMYMRVWWWNRRTGDPGLDWMEPNTAASFSFPPL